MKLDSVRSDSVSRVNKRGRRAERPGAAVSDGGRGVRLLRLRPAAAAPAFAWLESRPGASRARISQRHLSRRNDDADAHCCYGSVRAGGRHRAFGRGLPSADSPRSTARAALFTTVNVTEKEYKITLTKKTAKRGLVILR